VTDPLPNGHPARFHTAAHPEGLEARVRLRPDGLVVDAAGDEHFWPWRDLRRRGGEWAAGVVNLEREDAREMLSVTSPSFAGELRRAAPALAGARVANRGTRAAVGLLVALVVLVVGFFAALPWLAGLLAMRLPVEWEDRFGAAIVESAVPPRQRLEDPAVRAVVEGVVARLAAASPSPYTFRVTVADAPEVNAFAAPGGHMVVHRGLLAFARDGDELAAVLAHEMEHVTRRHVTRVFFQRASVGFLAALAGGQSADALGGGVEAVRMLGELSFGRAAEREADEGGLARLRAAGIAPAAMATMLERLAGEQKGAQPPELLSTHPDPLGRAARMRTLALRAPAAPSRPAVTPVAWAALRAAIGAGAPGR
jgi:Zn-dependent protease with chaperone function